MHLLDGPAGFHKAIGEIVEQFWMRRLLSLFAEVARRADDALAEMILPNAVPHDAGRQWMVRPGDPLSQFQPAAALGDGRLLLAGQDDGEAARHYIATGQI